MTSFAKGPTDLIIFGGTGDLSARMLLPSLYFLDADGYLPVDLRIVLIGRTCPQGGALVNYVKAKLEQFAGLRETADAWPRFAARLSGLPLNVEDQEGFAKLGAAVGSRCCIFYLATSPALFAPICSKLAAAGLNQNEARVVLEKPIGRDLASSRAINQAVAEKFPESAIFRIDHYLGKETVQNLMALRFANVLFESVWNAQRIDNVQITVAETVGVEGRWNYYDRSGAVRDMLQNHLLQLLCLVAMEPPVDMESDAVRDEKVKVLRSLRSFSGEEAISRSVFGQYGAGEQNGRPVAGYCDEMNAEPSTTETFVAVRAEISNWRWAGVPFYLRTGKRMPNRFSEIHIQFRDLPHSVFGPGSSELSANRLSIRLQPDETIKFFLMNKSPGLSQEFKLHELSLNLTSPPEEGAGRRRIAYERLLLDIIQGNATLFVRRDEVEAAWQWIDGIAAAWHGRPPLKYAAGSWGPSEATDLLGRFGHSWHDET